MPKLFVVERDYPRVGERWAALGPLLEQLGTAVKGASWEPAEEVAELAAPTAPSAAASPTAVRRWSGASRRARRSWLVGHVQRPAGRGGVPLDGGATGVPLADLAASRAGDRITFADAQVQPRTVITSPEWSGIEAHGRRYAPFTINVERDKPWHTLSGRQHFYLDHAWMLELGEGLPVFRPPLHHRAIFGDQGARDGSGAGS